MTKTLPHVTQVIAQLAKPWLLPWGVGLGVEFMGEKAVEFVEASTSKILKEIKDYQLVKIESIKEKLRIINDEAEKKFLGDSEIQKEAKSQPTKIRDEAADRGKRAHAAIETFLKEKYGAQIAVDEDIAKPFGKFFDWWTSNDLDPVEVECPVWSEDEGGFTGRFDLAANLKKEGKNILYLIDIKFTPRIYDDVNLQLAAYFYGWKQRTNYIPDRAAVLRLDFTDGPEQFKEILESELYDHYKSFLSLVKHWHLVND